MFFPKLWHLYIKLYTVTPQNVSYVVDFGNIHASSALSPNRKAGDKRG